MGKSDKQDYKIIRKKPLYRIFTDIPHRYDLINHIITWGMDILWRSKSARECLTTQPEKVLDLCCGTGDLAINISNLARYNVEVTGLDYSQPMLEIAVRKSRKTLGGRQISFIYGDAAHMPFPDDYFDCIGISFAFRNLTYRNPMTNSYLAEILRILKPDGRFVIVETSQPRSGFTRSLFHIYLRSFVFRTGHWLSGNKGAYQYLAESASRFYASEELRELLTAADFREVYCHPLFLGVASIYTAIK